jgi:periplasmic protein TonB
MIGKSEKIALTILASFALALCLRAQSVADITDALSKVDEPPVPVKTVAPEYPADLRRNNVGGVASILMVIDEKGEVLAAEVTKVSRDEFKQPALDAVRKWKFKPAETAGKAVKVKVTIPIRFSLAD